MTTGVRDDRRLIRLSGGLLAITVALGMGVAAVGVRAAAGATLRDVGLSAAGGVGLAVLFVFAAIGAAAKYHDHVRSTQAATIAQERLRRATSVVLLVSAVLVPFALLLLLRRPGTPRLRVQPHAVRQPPLEQPSGKGSFSFDLRAFVIVLLIVIGVLVLAGLVAGAIRLLRTIPVVSRSASALPTGESEAEDAALADALRAGRSALAGDDVRGAIIACYAAMESSLEQAGVIRERSDSPADLLQRAMGPDLPAVAAQHAATLTDVFREARFSTHPMTARQLDEARTALDAVTAALTKRIRAHARTS